ncbi:MAG: hypothetical protein MJ071_04725 [Oscillospiraceae bacterium]|nr:hypothetical protein [Oscillospiraceae bacterium]
MTEKETKKKSIYLVVTSTGTGVARAIRVFSRMPYSHVSLSKDASLHQLYSFCRNYTITPLPATFNTEMIGEGTLGKFENIPCEIYKIPLTDRQYDHFEALIEHFIHCRKRYSYSVIGLLMVKFQIHWKPAKKFVCSQFVAYVLDECGVALDKPACLYSPEDLRYLPDAQLIYRGELNRYYHDQNETMSYVSAVSQQFN